MIALLIVLTVTYQSIFVDVLPFFADSQSKRQNIQSNILNTDSNDIRSINELNLAESDTPLGQVGESLKNGYEDFVIDCTNKKDLSTAINDFKQLVSELKNQAIKELDLTDNGTDEYDIYRLEVLSNFEDLYNCIGELNAENTKEILNEIQEKVAPEQQYIGLADNLPFDDVSVDKILTETYTETESTDYIPDTGSCCQSNLEFTNDAVINDDIRFEFAELSSVLEIYQYIKNNYMPEFYYGSRKGSVGAFEEKAGNDYDLSSLLIAVLRDRGIPARYVRGEIEITAEQAIEWTAADNINAAIRMLAALGIPVTSLTTDNGIVAVRLEHIWVEAYVPYTDYRGTGNQSGESLWIPLDVSFKELNHLDGVDLTSLTDYISDENNFLTSDTEMNGVNVGELSTVVSGQESALVKYLLENGYAEANLYEVFGGKEIVSEDLGYLPITLPYTVSKKIDSFDDISLELTDSISFSLVGNSAYELEFSGSKSINQKLYTPNLYGKRIVLSYTPATEADEKLLKEYENIFKTPAYLLKLKPQLIIDGEVVAEGAVCNAGYRQKYTINVHNGSPNRNDSSIENSIVAGGMYCIALDYGNISAVELEKLSSNLDTLKETVSEENIYTDSEMGEILNTVAKSYFAQLDVYNSVVAGQNNVTSARDLSIGIVGFNVNVTYTFNRPAELNEGGIFLDIGHDVHSVVSNENNNKDEKEYMLQSGIYASAMEHGILEQITGVESVSTIKVLEYAVNNNIPLHTIVKENISTEIEIIDVSEQIKQEIRSSVNAGKMVIIPEQEIEINQWSGTGYMVLDPDTFACGYMISGGLAGGAMTAGEMLAEYVQYVVVGAVYIVAWEIFKTVALAMTPCGWLSVINMLFVVTEVLMLLNAVVQMVSLVQMYLATGDIYYLQELLVQVTACVTLGIASKLLGNKLAQLKDKVTNAIDEAGLSGKCFIAGTLIVTTLGLVPIEKIVPGDTVYSFNPETLVVSEQLVEETFVRESNELVHIQVGSETISATPDHPFYVPQKGFVDAIELRAGDALYTVNGKYVIVEQIQHEILELPVKVYNFRVANNHTYFVGNTEVGVHNATYAKNNYNWGNESTLQDHYMRHGKDVGASSASEYAKIADEFYNNRANYQVKVDSNGIIRVYDATRNIFGSYNPNGTTRTLFSPTRGQSYFNSQPGV